MKLRLLRTWEDLRASFWFVPGLMALAALIAAFLLVRVDVHLQAVGITGPAGHRFFGPEGARTILSTVAGSALTVTSIVFSITMVVLNMASAQFGPRLLRNFMDHGATQIVLGFFVAAFSFCLFTLAMVRSGDGRVFVPDLAVAVGLLSGIISFAFLIYFLHHVAVFIQAPRIIDDVARRLEHAIRSGLPVREEARRTPDEEEEDLPSRLEKNGRAIPMPGSGYVQAIDEGNLIALAREFDLTLWLRTRPGLFLMRGLPCALVGPAEKVDEAVERRVAAAFVIGPQRTATQDPEFAVDQLVEVAVRALSPGVNDPFTAVNCIDRLGAALALLGGRELPSRYRRDQEGTLRLITDPFTYGGIVSAAFDQIRQNGRGTPAVVFRLLETIASLGRIDLPEPCRKALAEQTEAIRADNQESWTNAKDRRDFEERLESALTALTSKENFKAF